MPDMAGLDLLAAITEMGLEVPVAIVTADIQLGTRHECYQRGAVAVVNKPVDDERLENVVSKALAGPSKITPDQADALTELINIGIGRAAGLLNEMTDAHVSLSVPSLVLTSLDELNTELGGMSEDALASVQLRFSGSFRGTAALVFPTESAKTLVTALTDEEHDELDLDEVRAGTLNEVGNIVINGVMGSITNVLQESIEYAIPDYKEDTLDNLFRGKPGDEPMTVLLATTHFAIETLRLDGEVILLFEVGTFDVLMKALTGLMDD